MGCKGSKHAHGHGGGGGGGGGPLRARAPELRRYSGLVGRHSVALKSSTLGLGTLSLDRAAAAAAAAKAAGVSAVSFAAGGGVDGEEAMMKAGHDGGAKSSEPSRKSFSGWRPAKPPAVAPAKRRGRAAAPRTPNKTPARAPEEINVWELIEGLDDDGDDQEDESEPEQVDGHGFERKARSAPGSPPVFDPEILDAFRKALDELSPASPPPPPGFFVTKRTSSAADVKKGETTVQSMMFPAAGIVQARVSVFQEKIDAKQRKKKPPPSSPPPRPPPESARRVVVYLTSLRGIRQTYEDCWSTAAVLRGYGVRVDERDLSLHAGYKDELRAALGDGACQAGGLPQVFADGRHLGGAEEVRRMHESGELAKALEACEAAPAAAGAKGGGGCSGCGGVRFVPCDTCSGSCKVFVEDEDGAGAGAFRRCPDCNENGLVRCPVC